MKKYFISISLSLSLFFLTNAMAQEATYKTKIIDGKEYYEYHVQTSEGFYSVSKKFHVTETEIKEANPGSEKGLSKGSTILIPVKRYTFHKVEKSETLFSLKEKYNTTYDELYKLNPTLKNEGLKYGMEIKVPKKAQTSGQATKVQTKSPEVASVKKETKPGFTTHEVKKGETLSSISRTFGVSTEEILRLNPDAKDGVKVGNILIIPPAHANTAVTTSSNASSTPKASTERPKIMYRTHKVQKKETLFSISQDYGVSREEIIKLNPGVDKELEVGKVLTIPEKSQTTAAAAPSAKSNMYKIHKVQKKETLFSISQDYGVSQEVIIKLNPGVDKELEVGRMLSIPEKAQTAATTVPASKSNMYKIHKVQKKETLFSISQDYGVTPEEIVKLNPDADKKLKKGMTLTIPQPTPPAPKAMHYGAHTVKKGETVFSISQQYGIGKDDIIKYNPSVAQELQEGRVLLIAQEEGNQGAEAQTNGYKFHKVQKEETIFSISQKYNVTQNEIISLNPDVKTELLSDKVLLIPEISSADMATAPKNEVNVALALPFNFSEVTENSALDGKTEKFLELYQGMLIAIDSLKRRGLSINLHVYDSGNDETDAKLMLAHSELKDMDFIIGPAYASQIKILADYAAIHKVKLIVPFSSKSEETVNNPYVFQINTPQDQHNYLTAKAIIETFKGANIVLLSFKNDVYNTKTALKDTLGKMMTARNIKFRTITYSSIESLKKELSAKEENVLITLTNNQVALNQILPVINMMGDKYTVSTVGFPEWQSYQSISKDLFRVNTYIPSTFYIEFKNEDVKRYLKSFRETYNAEPENLQPQYGMLGYDLMMYFSDAVSCFGHNFENKLTEVKYKPLQSGLTFKKISGNGGYYNGSVFLTNHNPQTGLSAVKFE